MTNKTVCVIISVVSLLLGLALAFGFGYVQEPQKVEKTTPQESNLLSQVLIDYDVVAGETIDFGGKEERFTVFGFAEDKMGGDSFLEIFKKSNGELESVYKFKPALPENLYPNPLTFEKMWALMSESTESGLPKPIGFLTSWGEIGADYFGTHPIVIKLEDGKFKAVDFYEGELSDDPKIKKSEWTSRDFEVKNSFDETNQVKTILTQGVSLEDNQAVLRFISDNACKACEHIYTNLKFTIE